jgi:hypothetical protein
MKLTFTVGKYYRTRDGRKAKCLVVTALYARFFVENGEMVKFYNTNLEGDYTPMIMADLDIVAEWSETKDTKALIEAYEAACDDLVKAFAEKQGLEFDYVSGGFYWFSNWYCLQIEDIILDLKTEQEKGFILKWFEVWNRENGGDETEINYNSYIMARGKVLITNTEKL